jgi:hypothetical protein
MNIYELDISWATSASEQRRLHWELIASDEVKGVFVTTRANALAVLYTGDRRGFEALARTLAPESLETVQ